MPNYSVDSSPIELSDFITSPPSVSPVYQNIHLCLSPTVQNLNGHDTLCDKSRKIIYELDKPKQKNRVGNNVIDHSKYDYCDEAMSPIMQMDVFDDSDLSLWAFDNNSTDPPDLRMSQLDGVNDSIVSLDSITANVSGNKSNDIRIAPYLLDQEKQINKLGNDANKIDFELSVSPNEHSVSIICSTGSYSLIVIPTFSTITKGCSLTIDDSVVDCYDVINKVDKSNAIVNTVYFFRVTFPRLNKNNSAKVTVHLHCTTRRVQVQGGTFLSKGMRACIWFVEKMISKHFLEVSRSKAVDIANFNSDIRRIVDAHMMKLSTQDKC